MEDTYEHTDLCAGCNKDKCSHKSQGCLEYRCRFIEWWDTNIHRHTANQDEKEE